MTCSMVMVEAFGRAKLTVGEYELVTAVGLVVVEAHRKLARELVVQGRAEEREAADWADTGKHDA